MTTDYLNIVSGEVSKVILLPRWTWIQVKSGGSVKVGRERSDSSAPKVGGSVRWYFDGEAGWLQWADSPFSSAKVIEVNVVAPSKFRIVWEWMQFYWRGSSWAFRFFFVFFSGSITGLILKGISGLFS